MDNAGDDGGLNADAPEWDPFTVQDPWAADHNNETFAGVTTGGGGGGQDVHGIRDRGPPVWDGKNPEERLDMWVLESELWLQGTKVPGVAHGREFLGASQGDLKMIVFQLGISALKQENSGRLVIQHILNAYKHVSKLNLTRIWAQVVYNPQAHRQRGETFTGLLLGILL